MTKVAPIVQYLANAPAQGPAGPSIPELCAAARALIAPTSDATERFGPDIENGFIDLAVVVDDFERRHVVGKVPSYRLEEALGTTRRIREVGIREQRIAADELRSARASIDSLGIVPPINDLVDGLIDQEIRATVRSMTATKRAELLEEMRSGQQIRAMLAAARNPMPSDFDTEAATLYSQHSEPVKRAHLAMRVEIYDQKRSAAKRLIEAGDATKAIVARFIELEAALDAATAVETSIQQASMVTLGDATPRVSLGTQPI